ncbi:hypothetical protein [Methanosarcina mazei]|nr:hypothetical protein [Methanosarcina mazei]
MRKTGIAYYILHTDQHYSCETDKIFVTENMVVDTAYQCLEISKNGADILNNSA